MLNRARAWLKTLSEDRRAARLVGGDAKLAAAALLVEAAVMDGEFGEAERLAVTDLLSRRFDLDAEETQALVSSAEERQESSSEIFKLVYVVRETFDEAECAEFMFMLWSTVLADGELHDFEASLMRRIAGLLHVPDRVSGEARKRAIAKLGGGVD